MARPVHLCIPLNSVNTFQHAHTERDVFIYTLKSNVNLVRIVLVRIVLTNIQKGTVQHKEHKHKQLQIHYKLWCKLWWWWQPRRVLWRPGQGLSKNRLDWNQNQNHQKLKKMQMGQWLKKFEEIINL